MKKNQFTLWVLAWPIFIETFLQFLLGAADTLMVSSISDDAVAVVGFSNQLFNGLYVLFQAIAGGAGILIAQKLGAREERDARSISILALQLVAAIAVVFSIVLALKPLWFAKLLRYPVELYGLAEIYISIIGGGALLVAMMFAPGCRLIASHMGLPGTHKDTPTLDAARAELAPLLALAPHPNVFVKLSGFYAVSDPPHVWPHAAAAPFVKVLVDGFGADRCLWASDFSPALDHVSFIQTITVPGLDAYDEATRAAVMGGNLLRILGRTM